MDELIRYVGEKEAGDREEAERKEESAFSHPF